MTNKVTKTFIFSFITDKITIEYQADTLVSDLHKEIIKIKPEFENLVFDYIDNAVLVDKSKKASEVGEILYTSVSVAVTIKYKEKDIPVKLMPWQNSDDLEALLLRHDTFNADSVIEFFLDGKLLESIPALNLKNAVVTVKIDLIQLVEIRKKGYSDELAKKALDLTKWNYKDALVILNNNLFENEPILIQLLGMFDSFSGAMGKLNSFNKDTLNEALLAFNQALIDEKKEAEIKAFESVMDNYAKIHDFQAAFKTNEHKELALQYGFVENNKIEEMWQQNKIQFPYLVAVAAALFTNNSDFVANTKTTILQDLDSDSIKKQALKEGILQEKTIYPENVTQESIQHLMEFGFDMTTVIRALYVSRGNKERAINAILSNELEQMERERGMNAAPAITKSNVIVNVRAGQQLSTLQLSQKDPSNFLEFMKAVGLKHPDFYMYPDIFASCLGIPKPVPVEPIVKYGLAKGFVPPKKFLELNNSFGRSIENIDPEKAAELLSVIGDYDPDICTFILEAYDNSAQRVLEEFEKE